MGENPDYMGSPDAYIVLVGDLVASKRAPDRAATQERLEATLEHIGRPAAKDEGTPFLVPPMVTVGDEFQALLAEPGPVVDVMRRVRESLWPIQVSFGVARGSIATPIRREHIGRMDGPVFHRAREAIQLAKPHRGTAFKGFGAVGDTVLFGLYQGLHAVARRWTDRQVEVMARARTGGTQAEMAADLGVTQSAISESLGAAGYDQVRDIEAAARTLIDALHRGQPIVAATAEAP